MTEVVIFCEHEISQAQSRSARAQVTLFLYLYMSVHIYIIFCVMTFGAETFIVQTPLTVLSQVARLSNVLGSMQNVNVLICL